MIVIFICSISYIAFIIYLIYGFKRLPKEQDYIELPDLPEVSIVIAFRNEEENLKDLLGSLLNQSYPRHLLDIVLVNDHSSDKGVQLIKEVLDKKRLNYRIVSLIDKEGKKWAIETGVSEAKHDLVLTTDADCIMGEDWILSMVSSYVNSSAVMLLGPVTLKGERTLFSKFQELEFSTLQVVTASTVALRRPIMSNGANLAYSKRVFQEISPFNKNRNVSSGDDVFFLHELKKNDAYKRKINFANSKDALVYSSTKAGLGQFIDQRVRWGSKSKHYRDYETFLMTFFIFFVNLGFLLLLYQGLIMYFAIFFTVKWIADYWLMKESPNWVSKSNLLIGTFFLSLVYPFYTIGIALLSLLYRPEWKARKINFFDRK